MPALWPAPLAAAVAFKRTIAEWVAGDNRPFGQPWAKLDKAVYNMWTSAAEPPRRFAPLAKG